MKTTHSNHTSAVIKAIVYADIFNFPVTLDELAWLAISPVALHTQKIMAFSSPLVDHKDGFFCLRGREKIIAKRLGNKQENKKKLLLAHKYASVLMHIPSIYCIGISGSLAVENATEGDDIDLFIITKKNTVWITRLLCLILLTVLGKRRKRGVIKAPDSICLNMMIDETHLSISPDKQDVYIAHEIVQFIPLYQRGNMYHKFLQANSWIKSFLGNSNDFLQKKMSAVATVSPNVFIEYLCMAVEPLAYLLQYIFIQRHKTIETAEKNQIAFHPLDHRLGVLRKYKTKLKKYRIEANFVYLQDIDK